jgi:hypothetical protein
MTNPDYDLLFEHLRGYRDIVINKQHGGFGLSHGAQIAYLERSQIPYRLIDRDDRHSNQRYGPYDHSKWKTLVRQRHYKRRSCAGKSSA